jgi:hypothetical protein
MVRRRKRKARARIWLSRFCWKTAHVWGVRGDADQGHRDPRAALNEKRGAAYESGG